MESPSQEKRGTQVITIETDETVLTAFPYKPHISLLDILKGEPKLLGAIQILLALVIMSLGIIFAFNVITFSKKFPLVFLTGYPFWGALIFFLTGLVTMIDEKPNKIRGLPVTTMNVISSVVAVAGITFTIISFTQQHKFCQMPSLEGLCVFGKTLLVGALSILLIISIAEFSISVTIASFRNKCWTHSNQVVFFLPSDVIQDNEQPDQEEPAQIHFELQEGSHTGGPPNIQASFFGGYSYFKLRVSKPPFSSQEKSEPSELSVLESTTPQEYIEEEPESEARSLASTTRSLKGSLEPTETQVKFQDLDLPFRASPSSSAQEFTDSLLSSLPFDLPPSESPSTQILQSSSSQDEPPQEEPPQDEPPQDEPPQDEPPQDEPPQDEPPQDEPPQDEPPKDEPPKDEPPKDEPPKDEPPKDEPPEDEPPEDEPPEDEPPQDEPPEDEPPQEEPPKDEPSQDEPKDEPPQEEPPQKTPSQEEPSQEEPPQKTPSQDEPSQEEPPQKTPSQDEPSQEEPPTEIPPQEEPSQEEPPTEIPPQEEPSQEEPPTEIPPQEEPSQEEPPTEIPPQEEPPQDIAPQDEPPEDIPSHHTPSQESLAQETAPQDVPQDTSPLMLDLDHQSEDEPFSDIPYQDIRSEVMELTQEWKSEKKAHGTKSPRRLSFDVQRKDKKFQKRYSLDLPRKSMQYQKRYSLDLPSTRRKSLDQKVRSWMFPRKYSVDKQAQYNQTPDQPSDHQPEDQVKTKQVEDEKVEDEKAEDQQVKGEKSQDGQTQQAVKEKVLDKPPKEKDHKPVKEQPPKPEIRDEQPKGQKPQEDKGSKVKLQKQRQQIPVEKPRKQFCQDWSYGSFDYPDYETQDKQSPQWTSSNWQARAKDTQDWRSQGWKNKDWKAQEWGSLNWGSQGLLEQESLKQRALCQPIPQTTTARKKPGWQSQNIVDQVSEHQNIKLKGTESGAVKQDVRAPSSQTRPSKPEDMKYTGQDPRDLQSENISSDYQPSCSQSLVQGTYETSMTNMESEQESHTKDIHITSSSSTVRYQLQSEESD
ncbi:membrane-spanning 4-domains subfamily A member 14 isoform 1-T1 [Thomomys bottae]